MVYPNGFFPGRVLIAVGQIVFCCLLHPETPVAWAGVASEWPVEAKSITLAHLNFTFFYKSPNPKDPVFEISSLQDAGKFASGATGSAEGVVILGSIFGPSSIDTQNVGGASFNEISSPGGETVGSGESGGSNSTENPKSSAEKGPGLGCMDSWSPPAGQPWVALIAKGACDVNLTLRAALKHNASAVFIYYPDVKPGHRITTPPLLSENQSTVVVFLSADLGNRVASSIRNGTLVRVAVNKGTHTYRIANVNRTSVLFVSVSFIVLMVVSLAWLVFYYIQRFRYINAKDRLQKHLSNAAKKALSKIPVKNIKTGDREITLEECCAVCIEPYTVQDSVRVLPCRHEFHKSCVDPWLLDHRTCPMCKMDILKHYGYTLSVSDDSNLHLDHHIEDPNLGVNNINNIHTNTLSRSTNNNNSSTHSISHITGSISHLTGNTIRSNNSNNDIAAGNTIVIIDAADPENAADVTVLNDANELNSSHHSSRSINNNNRSVDDSSIIEEGGVPPLASPDSFGGSSVHSAYSTPTSRSPHPSRGRRTNLPGEETAAHPHSTERPNSDPSCQTGSASASDPNPWEERSHSRSPSGSSVGFVVPDILPYGEPFTRDCISPSMSEYRRNSSGESTEDCLPGSVMGRDTTQSVPESGGIASVPGSFFRAVLDSAKNRVAFTGKSFPRFGRSERGKQVEDAEPQLQSAASDRGDQNGLNFTNSRLERSDFFDNGPARPVDGEGIAEEEKSEPPVGGNHSVNYRMGILRSFKSPKSLLNGGPTVSLGQYIHRRNASLDSLDTSSVPSAAAIAARKSAKEITDLKKSYDLEFCDVDSVDSHEFTDALEDITPQPTPKPKKCKVRNGTFSSSPSSNGHHSKEDSDQSNPHRKQGQHPSFRLRHRSRSRSNHRSDSRPRSLHDEDSSGQRLKGGNHESFVSVHNRIGGKKSSAALRFPLQRVESFSTAQDAVSYNSHEGYGDSSSGSEGADCGRDGKRRTKGNENHGYSPQESPQCDRTTSAPSAHSPTKGDAHRPDVLSRRKLSKVSPAIAQSSTDLIGDSVANHNYSARHPSRSTDSELDKVASTRADIHVLGYRKSCNGNSKKFSADDTSNSSSGVDGNKNPYARVNSNNSNKGKFGRCRSIDENYHNQNGTESQNTAAIDKPTKSNVKRHKNGGVSGLCSNTNALAASPSTPAPSDLQRNCSGSSGSFRFGEASSSSMYGGFNPSEDDPTLRDMRPSLSSNVGLSLASSSTKGNPLSNNKKLSSQMPSNMGLTSSRVRPSKSIPGLSSFATNPLPLSRTNLKQQSERDLTSSHPSLAVVSNSSLFFENPTSTGNPRRTSTSTKAAPNVLPQSAVPSIASSSDRQILHQSDLDNLKQRLLTLNQQIAANPGSRGLSEFGGIDVGVDSIPFSAMPSKSRHSIAVPPSQRGRKGPAGPRDRAPSSNPVINASLGDSDVSEAFNKKLDVDKDPKDTNRLNNNSSKFSNESSLFSGRNSKEVSSNAGGSVNSNQIISNRDLGREVGFKGSRSRKVSPNNVANTSGGRGIITVTSNNGSSCTSGSNNTSNDKNLKSHKRENQSSHSVGPEEIIKDKSHPRVSHA